jgi:hypothetical protein
MKSLDRRRLSSQESTEPENAGTADRNAFDELGLATNHFRQRGIEAAHRPNHHSARWEMRAAAKNVSP